eukprot:jgi/Hompol1/5132/HPOL_004171-RA
MDMMDLTGSTIAPAPASARDPRTQSPLVSRRASLPPIFTSSVQTVDENPHTLGLADGKNVKDEGTQRCHLKPPQQPHETSTPTPSVTQLLSHLAYSLHSPSHIDSAEQLHKIKHRRSMSNHTTLAKTAVGLRDIAKKIGETSMQWEAPPATVMIITKLHDQSLVQLTSDVA